MGLNGGARSCVSNPLSIKAGLLASAFFLLCSGGLVSAVRVCSTCSTSHFNCLLGTKEVSVAAHETERVCALDN